MALNCVIAAGKAFYRAVFLKNIGAIGIRRHYIKNLCSSWHFQEWKRKNSKKSLYSWRPGRGVVQEKSIRIHNSVRLVGLR